MFLDRSWPIRGGAADIYMPLRPFLTRKFFQEILGLEGSNNFIGKFRQMHNLDISDRLLGRFLWEQNLVRKS